jgi:hypothetical protein
VNALGFGPAQNIKAEKVQNPEKRKEHLKTTLPF